MSEAPSPFTADERALLRQAAEAVVRRRLAVPAMMLLETVTPMNVVTSSMLTMLSPVWRAALPASRIDQVATLLERRDALPALVALIDELEEQRRRDEKAERARRRDERRRRRGRAAPSAPGRSP